MSSIESGPVTSGDQMTPVKVPTLQPGDRLSQPEFLRRYGAMPNLKHAELIEGVVYMTSPVSAAEHGEPHAKMLGWLFSYSVRTLHAYCGDNSTIRMDLDNVPQPDCYLRIGAEQGGQSRMEDGYIVGAPELIAEVAASTASYDLHDKFRAYQRNAVREYIVWRVRDAEIDWFVLYEGRFQKIKPGEDGILRSELFPGLWLDPKALVANDMPRVMAVLDEGLKSGKSAG